LTRVLKPSKKQCKSIWWLQFIWSNNVCREW